MPTPETGPVLTVSEVIKVRNWGDFPVSYNNGSAKGFHVRIIKKRVPMSTQTNGQGFWQAEVEATDPWPTTSALHFLLPG